MSILLLILVLVGIAVALWLVPGMNDTLRKCLIAVAVVLTVLTLLWLVFWFFGATPGDSLRGPRL